LVKFVLEAILVYWHKLAHIPKGILEKIKKYCFNILWQGCSDYKGAHWVNWRKLAVPKALGGWGLKDIHLFGPSLAATSLFGILSQKTVCGEGS